ncbi:RHS domain-containing protein [Treponema pedis]|uniref:RHS domain-containing protein n=1 Tax=Treponema pedis TaxID=409322 RepID=A0A7S6WRV3_9SPIR|nr:RHS domain-containing protein [Treponema pedis]
MISDHIGRPIQAIDDNGELVWSCDYDIYGRLKKLKGERTFIPFRQAGQIEDAELEGLYYNRFRWYNSETGTYLSQDPIGLAGGNPTIYGYVKDPNTWVDVFGLDCQESSRIAKELSEPEVLRRLKEQYNNKDYEILTQPRIYLKDDNGNVTTKYSKPDFMVIDRKSKTIVNLVDAKNGNGGFTDNQKQLIANGGEFRGSSRSEILGRGSIRNIEKGSLRDERTSFTIEDLN